MYNLPDFFYVRNFPLYLVMTSLWRHFLSNGFQICIFCETSKQKQSTSACNVDCLGHVLQRDYKTQWWRLYDVFSFLGFEVSIFCETNYKLLSCQVSNPSVIWIKFYRGVGIRHTKEGLWRYYDFPSEYLVFKIAQLVKLNRSYQLAKFHWSGLSGANCTRAGGKHPSPDLHVLKSAALIGLTQKPTITHEEKKVALILSLAGGFAIW